MEAKDVALIITSLGSLLGVFSPIFFNIFEARRRRSDERRKELISSIKELIRAANKQKQVYSENASKLSDYFEQPSSKKVWPKLAKANDTYFEHLFIVQASCSSVGIDATRFADAVKNFAAGTSARFSLTESDAKDSTKTASEVAIESISKMEALEKTLISEATCLIKAVDGI
ncbi:hypothetical protein [Pseudaestuariivita sp.]|uniref:hypothetical protein n=1 Tax=Pseudaestuariivita sp. TaxID=2211669 RepID=UPI00405824CF